MISAYYCNTLQRIIGWRFVTKDIGFKLRKGISEYNISEPLIYFDGRPHEYFFFFFFFFFFFRP